MEYNILYDTFPFPTWVKIYGCKLLAVVMYPSLYHFYTLVSGIQYIFDCSLLYWILLVFNNHIGIAHIKYIYVSVQYVQFCIALNLKATVSSMLIETFLRLINCFRTVTGCCANICANFFLLHMILFAEYRFCRFQPCIFVSDHQIIPLSDWIAIVRNFSCMKKLIHVVDAHMTSSKHTLLLFCDGWSWYKSYTLHV